MTDTERDPVEAIRAEERERVHRAYRRISQHVREETVEKVERLLAGGVYD